jgi:hypothetical protein
MRQRNVVKGGIWTRATDKIAASGVADLSLGCDEIATLRMCPSVDSLKLARSVPLVHFGAGKSLVEFTPLGLRNSVGVPVADNGRLYKDAWLNADYSVLNGGHILRDPITLRKGHPTSFSFRLDTQAGFDPKTLKFGEDFRILDPMLERGEEVKPLSWEVSQVGGKYVLTVRLPAGDWAGWTVDPTLILQPGAADGIDNSLRSGNPNTNYGTLGYWAVGGGEYVVVAKFNFCSLPSGAVLSSVILSLVLYQTGGADATYFLSRILPANSSWGELTSTWNKRDGVNAWAGSVGCGTSGTDYSATKLWGPADPGIVLGTQIFNLNLAETILMVANNNGLVHGRATPAQRFYRSSDYGTAGERPMVTVVYTLPGLRVFSNPFQSPFSGGFA